MYRCEKYLKNPQNSLLVFTDIRVAMTIVLEEKKKKPV
jgi:hypothetical protein